jgi:hypothetical protein
MADKKIILDKNSLYLGKKEFKKLIFLMNFVPPPLPRARIKNGIFKLVSKKNLSAKVNNYC